MLHETEREQLIQLSNHVKALLQDREVRIAIKNKNWVLIEELKIRVAEVDSLKGWPE